MVPPQDHVVVVKSSGRINGYVTYATKQLQKDHGGHVLLVSMDMAISKGISVAEIIKRQNDSLTQRNRLISNSEKPNRNGTPSAGLVISLAIRPELHQKNDISDDVILSLM